ncbi:hypothetical protein ACIPSE_43150 [Streptomyces sp. NPDC090106]|uniref:hypothetical protein n=1 Tax=Streptomyces sp. NPDC090106 TaxID=3365946 RepID=UPI003809250B
MLTAGGDGLAVGHQDEAVALLGIPHGVRGDQDTDASVGLIVEGVPQPGTGQGLDAEGEGEVLGDGQRGPPAQARVSRVPYPRSTWNRAIKA